MVAAIALSTCACGPGSDGNDAAPATVDANAYQTYRNYSGYRRTYITETQFVTSTGVRCRIGPNTGDYPAGIRCWGPLPGVGPSVNWAAVSAFALDKDTHDLIVDTPVDPRRATYSYFGTADLDARETYLDSGLQQRPVDPSQYRLLGPGQMIEVPETVGGEATISVCITGADDTLVCEIRPTSDGETYGFQLSARGSRTY